MFGIFRTLVYSEFWQIHNSRHLVIIRHIQKWLTRILNPVCPWHFYSVTIKTLPCSEHVAYLESFLVFSIEPFIQNPCSKPSYTLIITYLHLFRNYSSLIGHILNLIWSWNTQNIDKFGTPPYLEPETY